MKFFKFYHLKVCLEIFFYHLMFRQLKELRNTDVKNDKCERQDSGSFGYVVFVTCARPARTSVSFASICVNRSR